MATRTVLIVEDNPKNTKVLVDLLSVHGYRTVTAEDGASGLEKARTVKPDLILMDVQLPRMDGYEATRRLKQGSDTNDIPIIIVTSFAMKGEEDRARELGASDYISKPIDIHALLRMVKKHLPAEKEPGNG